MSVTVVATFYPLPEHRDEVIGLLEGVIPRVHAEDEGCELYALNTGKDRLVMIEKWASMEALGAHGKGAVTVQLSADLQGKLSAPADIQVLRPHPSGTAAQGVL